MYFVFVVELVYDVDIIVVFGFFVRSEFFLVLNLEDDFYVFEGCGDCGYGNGGEEVGCGELGEGEVGGGVDGRCCSDDLFVEIVVLEGDSDCDVFVVSIYSILIVDFKEEEIERRKIYI